MISLIASGLLLISPVLSSKDEAAFAQLKKLEGTWVGMAEHGVKNPNTSVVYKVSANGSAVIETLFPGKPHEMVTVYTMDNGKLVGTHYCSMGNQPHLQMKSVDGKSVTLEFISGGNMKPGDGHMHKAVITFVDADHIKSNWYPMVDGKLAEPAKFDLERVK